MENSEGAIPAPQNAFTDDMHAPEIFVSGVAGAQFDGPNLRVTFFSTRCNHDPANTSTNNVVNLRLAMSIHSAKYLIGFLHGFVESSQLNETQKPPEHILQ